jgi:hypothetical protein
MFLPSYPTFVTGTTAIFILGNVYIFIHFSLDHPILVLTSDCFNGLIRTSFCVAIFLLHNHIRNDSQSMPNRSHIIIKFVSFFWKGK